MRYTPWCRPSEVPTLRSRSSGWRQRPARPAADRAFGDLPAARRRFAIPAGAVPHRPHRRGRLPGTDTAARIEIAVSSLIEAGEAPHRGLSYRRLLRLLHDAHRAASHDRSFRQHQGLCRKTHPRPAEGRLLAAGISTTHVAAHHSALDMQRRRATEAALKSGRLRAVITSTSLELGVDIGTADLVVQVGLPGSVARCVQRIGRSGHRPGAASRGILLASTPAELAGAVDHGSRQPAAGRIEPLRMIEAPLDVVCQQLVGMACSGEQAADAAFALFRKTGPMAELSQADFEACLDYLAGELPGPSGAYEPERGPGPAGPPPGSGKATAGSACAAAASPAGSGATSARSTRKSRCGCSRAESPSARSKPPTQSAS